MTKEQPSEGSLDCDRLYVMQAALTQAAETVVALQQQGGAAVQSRGPVLAPVELELRRMRLQPAREGAPADTRRLAEAVVAAYARLCHLSSCALDLRCALNHPFATVSCSREFLSVC